jgi:hypothetical protein
MKKVESSLASACCAWKQKKDESLLEYRVVDRMLMMQTRLERRGEGDEEEQGKEKTVRRKEKRKEIDKYGKRIVQRKRRR